MARKPLGGGVVTIAILHLVFGGLGLVGACITGFWLFFVSVVQNRLPEPGDPGNRAAVEIFLNEHLSSYFAFQLGLMIVNLILCVVMIAAGIGDYCVAPDGDGYSRLATPGRIS